MTTLVALATKDALVMGCDSLGTVTKELVDPFSLINEFFDTNTDEWKLKAGDNGEPLLRDFSQIWQKAQVVPFNSMTHVDKLFSLAPLEMGVMMTGISSIGRRTIKSIIKEFKNDKQYCASSKERKEGYTVKECAEALLAFIKTYYDKEFSEGASKPDLELMIGGYDKEKQVPSIYRIYVEKGQVEQTFPDEDPFGIAFGGQMQEIQRIVFGTDSINRVRLIARANSLIENTQTFFQALLDENGIVFQLPMIDTAREKQFYIFNGWDLEAFDANWGDFSEQNAIECVNFFVEIMIKSQQFSSKLPTVGGDVHIGLITKDAGFKYISREEYTHEGYNTPVEDRK